MIEEIRADCLANVHSHQRESYLVGPLIERAIEGGADVLGSMPNTNEGLTTAQRVTDYFDKAESLVPSGHRMHFIRFLMITEQTTERDIDECVEKGIVDGKVYTFMRTTKSENGVKHYARILPVVKHCGKVGMKVHFHPEHPAMDFNNRDAEFMFLPLVYMFLEETDAIIVWEHGTDARCIRHWEQMALSRRFFVTLTAHHLATNEDQTFGDVRSACKPPIKTERDRSDLVKLVCLDYPWVMAGGDDAFHDETAKHVSEGRCACGAYTAPFLLPLYAHALDQLLQSYKGRLKFVNFTSRNARRLHNLPPTSRDITLVRNPFKVPLDYSVGPLRALPFWAGQTIKYRIAK